METKKSKELSRHAIENKLIQKIDAKRSKKGHGNVRMKKRSAGVVALRASIFEIIAYKASVSGVSMEIPSCG